MWRYGLQKTQNGESGAFCFDQSSCYEHVIILKLQLDLFYHFTFYDQILMFTGVSVPKAVRAHAQTSILDIINI